MLENHFFQEDRSTRYLIPSDQLQMTSEEIAGEVRIKGEGPKVITFSNRPTVC
jgi:hypothetical protein